MDGRSLRSKLIELDHLKNTLLDTVSHDLRSPLAAMRAVTGVLRRDAYSPALTPEQRREFLAALDASAEKMRRLIDDLLDLDRLTSGPVPLQLKKVDLAEVVQASVLELSEALVDRNILLNLTPLEAEVDVTAVERIVENLLMNAAKHTPYGTPVTVTLQAVGDAALLRVDDVGRGIPEDMHKAVFERFCRISDHGSEGGVTP